MRRIVSGALMTLAIAGAVALAAVPAVASDVTAELRAAQSDKSFTAWLNALLARVQNDPRYRRLPLDTDARTAEFEVKLHEAYRGAISKSEFTAWADAAYPGHAYEVGVITGALPK